MVYKRCSGEERSVVREERRNLDESYHGDVASCGRGVCDYAGCGVAGRFSERCVRGFQCEQEYVLAARGSERSGERESF